WGPEWVAATARLNLPGTTMPDAPRTGEPPVPRGSSAPPRLTFSLHNPQNQLPRCSMLPYLFVILAIVFRLVIPHIQPHPWDFTPVGASLLFFGAYGSKRAVWIPVALFAATDVYLNLQVYHYPFGWDQFISFAWYAATIWLGTRLRDGAEPLPTLGLALTSSVSFFLVSNFGVWAAYAMYPKTLGGLIACYV